MSNATTSTLLFTNTRAQTEIWFQELLKLKPDWENQIAIHHGSLTKDIRTSVETDLKEGKQVALEVPENATEAEKGEYGYGVMKAKSELEAQKIFGKDKEAIAPFFLSIFSPSE